MPGRAVPRVAAAAACVVLLLGACGTGETSTERLPSATEASETSEATPVPRAEPDEYAEAFFDFPYERLEELVFHADAVGRGVIVDIVGGRTSTVGQNRALVVDVQRWWRGPGDATVVVEDGSWWEDGKTHGIDGAPWMMTGDDIFFVAWDSSASTADGDTVFEARNPFGVVLAEAPVPRPWLAQLPITTTADEYEARLDTATALVEAGEVDFVTPDERVLLVETWIGQPATIAAATATDGSGWELQVVETAVGFCYRVVPSGDTIPPGTGCWEWDSFVDGLQDPLLLPVGDGSLFVAAAKTGDPLADEYADLRIDPATLPFETPELPVDFYFGPTTPAGDG